jgi:hypothetical protein
MAAVSVVCAAASGCVPGSCPPPASCQNYCTSTRQSFGGKDPAATRLCVLPRGTGSCHVEYRLGDNLIRSATWNSDAVRLLHINATWSTSSAIIRITDATWSKVSLDSSHIQLQLHNIASHAPWLPLLVAVALPCIRSSP